MSNNQSRKPILLAIVLFLGTVTPVIVSAENTAVITNSVYSSAQTGGQSQSGVAGEDGRDGQDGADGTSGQSGASSAAASVTNHIQGSERHTVIVTATSGDAIVQSDSTSVATTSNSEDVLESGTNAASVPQASQLHTLLLLLQETLTAYVQKLF